jgi:hypothetical protein
VRQAEIATEALDTAGAAAPAAVGPAAGRPAGDGAFYQGKIAAARFFTEVVLPRLAADLEIVEATSLDLMELPEEAF